MNQQQIKGQIIDLLESTQRPGIDNLINYMGYAGFFEAPCSGQYHLCEPGGLAKHSLNVYNMMCEFANAAYTDFYDDDLLVSSVILVSLLHDLGKAGQFGKQNYVENYLKTGKISDTKPYVTNPDLIYVPHEIRSIQIASQFIELTEQESFAILQHNGMYGDLKYSLQGKETPLQLLLHFADMWCARVVEVEK